MKTYVRAPRAPLPGGYIAGGAVVLALLATMLLDEIARIDTESALRLIATLVGAVTLAGIIAWAAEKYWIKPGLSLDDEGLKFNPGLPAFLGERVRWSVRWTEIRGSQLLPGLRALQLFRQNNQPPLLLPLNWQRQGASEQAPMPVFPARAWRAWLETNDLWRELQRRGILECKRDDWRSEVASFDLAGHKGTRALLVLMAVLTVYIFFDAYATHETYAADSFGNFIPGAVLAVLMAVASYVWLQRSTAKPPPRTIAIGLVAVMLVVGQFTGFMAFIRAGQLFGGALQLQDYRPTANCDGLEPVDRQWPRLHFAAFTHPYFCSLPKGELRKVAVRHGLFGYEHAVLAPIYKDIGEYTGVHPEASSPKKNDKVRRPPAMRKPV